MKLILDTTKHTCTYELDGTEHVLGLYTKEAFALLSLQWLKIGWNQKYPYTFTWMGRPIIQLPEDMVRIQEILYKIKPDVLIETGIAHGGSLVYYASLCEAWGNGRVIGIDIEIRSHNRQAIEEHELSPLITLIEGNSIDPKIVASVKSLINPGESIFVILDSCHTKQHVAAELVAYHGLITPGSYIVATDGIVKDLYDVPRGHQEWKWDHPASAVAEFASQHPEFVLERPQWLFNESEGLSENVTYWPGAWLRRR